MKGRAEKLVQYKGLKVTVAAALLSTTMFAGVGHVSAASIDQLKREKIEAEQKQNRLKQDIDVKDSELAEKESKIKEYLAQVSELSKQVEETEAKAEAVRQSIAQTNEEIDALNRSIEALEQKIKERDDVLRERLRSIQAQGTTVSYLEVLLGATSFADFIDRFSAASTVMDADRQIMKQQEDDVAQIEDEKLQVEKTLKSLQAQEDELKQLQQLLNKQREEKNKVIDQLEKAQEQLSAERAHLQEDFEDTYELSQELEQQIIAEQQRIAEEMRKKEEARLAAEAAKRAASSGSGASEADTSALPPVTSGTWMTPAAGSFTSSFGWRTHPIHGDQRQHRGIDIANATGTPIVAAADGVVSSAGPMGGLGNAVFITHSIDGQMYTSVYGHMSSIQATVGQSVKKGDRIGAMGSTGSSTAPHLHFEVHVGGFTASGPSAVNPLRFISL